MGLALALFALALLVLQVQAGAVVPLAARWGAGLVGWLVTSRPRSTSARRTVTGGGPAPSSRLGVPWPCSSRSATPCTSA